MYLEAVLFDFDGTILDTETPDFVSWCEVFQEYDVTLDVAEWSEHLGLQFSPYQLLEGKLRRSLTATEMAEIRSRRRMRFGALMRREPVRPGVQELTESLESSSIPFGIVSNSTREWVETFLSQCSIPPPAVIVARECIAQGKPHPDSYLHATELLGVSSRGSIAIEDSYNGIAAARGAGIFSVLVPHPVFVTAILDGADLVVGSICELSVVKLDELVRSHWKTQL